MAITHSKQLWAVGSEVRVGVLRLRVTGIRAVHDGLPDIYDLESLDGARTYEFVPHNGLSRIT